MLANIPRKKYCTKCKTQITVTIPANRTGNVHWEDWLPCQNKDCKLYNKKVKKVYLART